MRYVVIAAGLLALLAGCSPAREETADNGGYGLSRGIGAQTRVTLAAPTAVETWLHPETSQRIMAARADFDGKELAALVEAERVMGAYRHVMEISREQYVRQYAGEVIPMPRSDEWLREHERRAAYARSILSPRIRAARATLERETLAALKQFFRRELEAGRIGRADYERYTMEIRRGHFPGFRGRKWSGPAVYEFRGADVSPEYRKVLQEVRRLWQAQGRRASAIVWTPADREFYRALVPPKDPGGPPRGRSPLQ